MRPFFCTMDPFTFPPAIPFRLHRSPLTWPSIIYTWAFDLSASHARGRCSFRAFDKPGQFSTPFFNVFFVWRGELRPREKPLPHPQKNFGSIKTFEFLLWPACLILTVCFYLDLGKISCYSYSAAKLDAGRFCLPPPVSPCYTISLINMLQIFLNTEAELSRTASKRLQP